MRAGRPALPWAEDIWKQIHAAVHDEVRRVAVAPKFLPLYGPLPDALTAPSDGIAVDDQERLSIDEAAVVRVFEVWSDFALTPQQVAEEATLASARTLAIRAANFITRARDAVIFQGDAALTEDPLFTEGEVSFRSGPVGSGLLNAADGDQVVVVRSLEPREARFGERTFAAVTEGYERLQNRGHYGPYALVLESVPYGDTFAPRPTTLVLPADRIQPLVTEGFYGTGGLPSLRGLLVSLGGDSMDLVIGKEATSAFLFEDDTGKSRFRVLTRFALRLKDPSAVARLEFRVRPAAKKNKAGAENRGQR